MTQLEYIVHYAPYLVRVLHGKPLYPSVMMAQALLESANVKGHPGESILAAKYRNHFGIKADVSWKGDKVKLSTTEFVNNKARKVDQYFRVYPTDFASFDDRIEFLMSNKRYKKGGVFEAENPYEQAERLQRCGYATDPKYASKLNRLMTKCNLRMLDDNQRFLKETSGPKKSDVLV